MTTAPRSRAYLLLVPLTIGGVAVALWLRSVGGSTLAAQIAGARLLWVVVMLGLTAAWLFTRFIRWQYLLRRAGVRVPIRPSLATYVAGLPGTATPGYVGEVVRGLFLRRRFGVSLGPSTAVLVLERLYDVAGLAIVLLATGSSGSRKVALLFLAALPFVAVALWPIARRAGVTPAALDRLRAPSTLAPAVALSIAAWAIAALLYAAGGRALGLSLGVAEGAAVFARSTLLGALTLLPAGFGVTGSLAIVSLGDLGLPLVTAVALVTLVRLTSTGAALAVGSVFLWRELTMRPGEVVADAAAHFDDIANEYNAQWSPHVWDLLLKRKLDLMTAELPPAARSGVGLDLGCGLGLQVAAMAERGFSVIGIDPSWGLLAEGRARGHTLLAGDALHLPFADESLDYAYCIGVLHHLGGREAQARAYAEIERVLKPGGVFLVHESNPRNPLFRFYMGYLFPILKSIDEGTEWWIHPSQPGAGDRFERVVVRYFTWLPDFTPRVLMSTALRLERMLERGPFQAFSAHYMAVLRKRAHRTDDVPMSARAEGSVRAAAPRGPLVTG